MDYRVRIVSTGVPIESGCGSLVPGADLIAPELDPVSHN